MDLTDSTALAIIVSIVLMVFALGLRSAPGYATDLLREPGLLGRSLVAMYLVMPTVVIALVASFELRQEVKVALVALALSPMPPFLPAKQLKLVTRESYVYGMLVVASATAIVLVPVTLALLKTRIGIASPLTANEMLRTVLVTVLVPLALGMVARRRWPAFAARSSARFNAVGGALLAVAGTVELATQWPELRSLIGDGTVLAIAAFTVVGLVVGHTLGGPRAQERTVLAVATAARHPAVAIGIVLNAFPDQDLAPTAVLLAVLVSTIAAAPYTAWRKRVHLERARV